MNQTITRIAVELLHHSPFNPRRTFSETGLNELATDIKHQGVLSPLLVRPRLDDADTFAGYTLVFGHRRLRAALLAGLQDVPCMVRVMTDAEAKRAQISENLSREDVHPIEEAEGFRALIDDGSETADSLAERYGKSRSYVYGRLTLLKACKEIRDACVAGEIGSEVALLISRIRTDKLQTKALAHIKSKHYSLGDGGARSYREIRDLLREKFTLSLKQDCMFDTTDMLLVESAGACTTCPKRAGNAPEFQDLATDQPGRWDQVVKGEPDLCTDPDCYDAKKKAHLGACAAELKTQGKTVIEGAKARAAIGADGIVKGAYIALNNVENEVKQARKAAQLDSKIVPPLIVTIQDPRTGKTIEAVQESDLVAAKTRTAMPQTQKKAHNSQERQRRDAEERKAREDKASKAIEMNIALLERVRTAVHQAQRDAQDLRLVVRVAVNGVGYSEIGLLANLWGCGLKEDLIQKLDSMSVEDLTKLLMDCALVDGVVGRSYLNPETIPETLRVTATRYGVSIEPHASLPLPPAARAPKGNKGKPEKTLKPLAPAARAQTKVDTSAAAGQSQKDEAGVTAGGSNAKEGA